MSYHRRVPSLSFISFTPFTPITQKTKSRHSIASISMTSTSKTEQLTKIHEIQVGPFKLCGISIAAVETCIWMPSLSLAIDSGKSPRGAIPMKYMAITHGHCDHIHGLPLHAATRSLQKLPPATYFIPTQINEQTKQFIKSVSDLEEHEINVNLTPTSYEDEEKYIDIGKGKYIKSFKTYHTIASQGYIIYRKVRKLKEEYKNMDHKQFKKFNDIYIEKYIPEIGFTGDTTIQAIEECEDCRLCKVLVTEMTFIDKERSVDHARRLGHIHIEDVIDNYELFQHNQYVVFTHFSARYSNEQILKAMQRLPSGLREKSIAFGC